jgi:hypothetical protein
VNGYPADPALLGLALVKAARERRPDVDLLLDGASQGRAQCQTSPTPGWRG